MMHTLDMHTKSVQISIDTELLREIDSQPETKEVGRSAVIRKALRLFLELKRRKEIDDAYDRGYAGRGDASLEELEELMGAQQWLEQ